MTTQPWPGATMVICWGLPAASCRFHRCGAYQPPQPYTTNAAFRDLWTMPPSPGGLMQPSPQSPAVLPSCYGVFLPGDCAPLRWAVRGGPTSTSPPWALAELATQLHTLPTQPLCPRLSHHAAVATRSSPPVSSLRWALVSQFFRVFLLFRDSRPSLSWESPAFPAAALAAIFWESC